MRMRLPTRPGGPCSPSGRGAVWPARRCACSSTRCARAATDRRSWPTPAPTTRHPTPSAAARGFEHRRGGHVAVARERTGLQTDGCSTCSPLDLTGRAPDVDERFDGGALDESRWWPFYTAALVLAREHAARYDARRSEASRCASTPTPQPWAPELDGDIRVSHVQTGQFSGPVGSGHRAASLSRRARGARGSSRSAACGCRTSASSKRDSRRSGIPMPWSPSGRSGSRSGPTIAARSASPRSSARSSTTTAAGSASA